MVFYVSPKHNEHLFMLKSTYMFLCELCSESYVPFIMCVGFVAHVNVHYVAEINQFYLALLLLVFRSHSVGFPHS